MTTRQFKVFLISFFASFVIAFSSCAKVNALNLTDLFARSGDSTSQEFLKAQASVKHFREEIAKHPDEMKNYISLAEIYIQESRITGKHTVYFPVADGILAEVLRRNPDNFEANVLKAGMMMTEHQFADAKETIEKAIAFVAFLSTGSAQETNAKARSTLR